MRKHRNKKSKRVDKNILLSLLAFFSISLVAGYFISYFGAGENLITGKVVGGGLEDLGKQEKPNPNYGAVSGYLVFTIKDASGNVISSEKGSDYKLYFSKKNIADWERVKDSKKDFEKKLNDVDADGSGDICIKRDYETQRKFYDDNNNGEEDDNDDEFDVYSVETDDKGCFAARLKSGDYDIYAKS